MHANMIVTEKGVQNRDGVLYRAFTDGQMGDKEFAMCKTLVVDDSIHVMEHRPVFFANERVGFILHSICNRFMGVNTTLLIHHLYSFGYLQGIKAERNRQKKRKGVNANA